VGGRQCENAVASAAYLGAAWRECETEAAGVKAGRGEGEEEGDRSADLMRADDIGAADVKNADIEAAMRQALVGREGE
jgi:hypothetical protein